MPDESNERSGPPGNRRNRRRSKGAFEQLKDLLSPKKPRQSNEITEDHIITILIARRGRDAVFGANLFSEPAWDVLLELYAALLGGRGMSLADLARAIDTPESTTARWIAVLADRGLVTKESDTIDAGRISISLTAEGAAKMKQLVDHWGAAFHSI